jgi:hypothetical protein
MRRIRRCPAVASEEEEEEEEEEEREGSLSHTSS